jgi:hypothetical protein
MSRSDSSARAVYPDLEAALSAWVQDSLQQVLNDVQATRISPGLLMWRRDSDGLLRRRNRDEVVWARDAIEQAQKLPSWARVLEVIQAEPTISAQLDLLVGTTQGGFRVEANSLMAYCLPNPNEISDLESVFAQRYRQLENYLTAKEFEYSTIWPLPVSTDVLLPIVLEQDVELDVLSDRELEIALNVGIVGSVFPQMEVFSDDHIHRMGLRYSYKLPKVTEDSVFQTQAATKEREVLEAKLSDIMSALEQGLALTCKDPVLALGRLTILSDRDWLPNSGAVSYGEYSVPRRIRFGRVTLAQDDIDNFIEIWQVIRKPGLLRRQKGLALSLRRLSYQAQRERPEDELLDLMIAAEALYLSDLGNQSDRGELRYRLSLRAALLSSRSSVGYTRRQVFDLMRSAYDTRSALAHGGTPEPKIMKICGIRVPLPQLVAATRLVIVAGCRTSLMKAAAGETWPPDWEAMTFRR